MPKANKSGIVQERKKKTKNLFPWKQNNNTVSGKRYLQQNFHRDVILKNSDNIITNNTGKWKQKYKKIIYIFGSIYMHLTGQVRVHILHTK